MAGSDISAATDGGVLRGAVLVPSDAGLQIVVSWCVQSFFLLLPMSCLVVRFPFSIQGLPGCLMAACGDGKLDGKRSSGVSRDWCMSLWISQKSWKGIIGFRVEGKGGAFLAAPPCPILTLLIAMGSCSWNSFTKSGTCKFLVGSQESCTATYPFHLTKYSSLCPLPLHLDPSRVSTLYSGSPLTRSGGGSAKFLPCSRVST